MANFRFHQISNTKKIRYISKIFKNSSFIVFLHGFMSDLEGKKPNALLKFAKKNKVSFLALEYSGHGKSSGKFILSSSPYRLLSHSLYSKRELIHFSIKISILCRYITVFD